MRQLARASATLALVLLAAPTARPDAADDAVKADEKLLRDAKAPADGPGLLDFLRKQTLAEAERARLAGLIGRLGGDDFKAREKASADLVAAGRPALAPLRRALKGPDEEVKQRARDCLDQLAPKSEAAVTAAALRLLRVRRPDGAAAVLLDFVPDAEDEAVEEETLRSLVVLGVKDGKADEAAAVYLKDRSAPRRAAAALLLGRSGTAEQKAAVKPLLADPDAGVRFRAAQGLTAGRDKAAVPALIALLADAPADVAEQAEELLHCVAGLRGPRLVFRDNEAARRQCRDAWSAWWKLNGPRADLTRADVDLPAFNATLRLRTTLRRFVTALHGGDADTAKKMSDAPFHLSGNPTAATRAEADAAIERYVQNVGVQPVRVLLTSLTPADAYLRTAPDDEKQFLARQQQRTELRAAHVQVTFEYGGQQAYALLLRVKGESVRVVGVGNGPAPAVPLR